MKNWGLVSLGGLLLVGGGLGVAACGDDTSNGGAGGATSTTGNPSGTAQGNPTTQTGATQPTSSTATATSSGTGSTTTGATTSATSSTSSTGSGTPGALDCTAPDGTPFTLTRTTIVSAGGSPDIQNLVQMKSAPDNGDRMYIVQQDGQVWIYEGGAVLATPFIDVSDLVDFDGAEQGLLGIAFHPDYATNGRFFLHYSNASGAHNSTVQEFHRSTGDEHVADHDPVQLVLSEPTAQSNHNGGAVEFGNDGYLYVSLGDGGNQGDPECDAQHSNNLLGKIMRLDVNGTPTASGYPAAAGNPSDGKAYHIGFRNPWRISFDGCTGDLYIGDVGQDMYEEVNHITAADGPRDFGWPYREGAHNYSTPGSCPANPGNLYEPFFDFTHGGGRCVATGGYVYRSSTIPGLRGTYFFADYCTGTMWTATPNGSGFTVAQQNAISGGLISAFGQDGNGNVYVVDYGGSIDRIDAN